jgi:hypothetical protein
MYWFVEQIENGRARYLTFLQDVSPRSIILR